MLTTAGAARSTASAYELTARGGLDGRLGARRRRRRRGRVAGGWPPARPVSARRMRRAMSSGRTITAMNAAASPTIAESGDEGDDSQDGRST